MNALSINNLCFLQTTFKPPKAIRGGIPICFPQVRALILLSICFCYFLYFCFQGQLFAIRSLEIMVLLSNMDLQGIDFGVLISIPHHFHQILLTGPLLT